jgi:hypothetical protein
MGLSPVQGVLPAVCKTHNSRLILMGNRPEGLIRRGRRRREQSGLISAIQLTRLWAGRLESWNFISSTNGHFSPYQRVETGSGAQPASCPMGNGGKAEQA